MYIWLRIWNLSKLEISSCWGLAWHQIENHKVACLVSRGLRTSWIVSSYGFKVMRTWHSFILEYFSPTTARHSESNHPNLWEETAVFLTFQFFDIQLSKKQSLCHYQFPYEGQNWLRFLGVLLIIIFMVTWAIYEICYSIFVVVYATYYNWGISYHLHFDSYTTFHKALMYSLLLLSPFCGLTNLSPCCFSRVI